MSGAFRPFLLAGVVAGAAIACAQEPFSVIEAVGRGHPVGHEQDGVEAVRQALLASGDVNQRDANGWTPLMYAALECRPAIVSLLLEHGADVRLRANSARKTPFMDHGQSALTLAAGCFVARQRAQLAPSRGMPQSYVDAEFAAPQQIVHALITHGADVNATDADGRTPLMLATMHGWAGVVRELLSAGVAVNARDQAGRLAIDYAGPQDATVLDLLRRAGSLPPTGNSGRIICDAERRLDGLGYAVTMIDCIPGEQFRAAVARFQKDKGLRPTGELDAATRKVLARLRP